MFILSTSSKVCLTWLPYPPPVEGPPPTAGYIWGGLSAVGGTVCGHWNSSRSRGWKHRGYEMVRLRTNHYRLCSNLQTFLEHNAGGQIYYSLIGYCCIWLDMLSWIYWTMLDSDFSIQRCSVIASELSLKNNQQQNPPCCFLGLTGTCFERLWCFIWFCVCELILDLCMVLET